MCDTVRVCVCVRAYMPPCVCVCACACYCVCVSTDNVATLFRASRLATMLMDQLMKLTAMDYLHSVLKDPVQRIADLKDSCEVYTVSEET